MRTVLSLVVLLSAACACVVFAAPMAPPAKPGLVRAPVCLLLHGQGETVSPPVLNSTSRYWGNLTRHLNPFCITKTYFTDTVNRGWDDAALQKEYCSLIESTGASVVITHSMANLVIAAGIHSKLPGCSKISRREGSAKGGVVWISSAAPLKGSPAADLCANSCPRTLFKFSGMCSCTNNSPPKSVQTCSSQYKSATGVTADHLMSAHRLYASRVMCGLDFARVDGRTPAGYATTFTVGILEGYGADSKTNMVSPFSGHDAIVTFASCRGTIPPTQFKADWRSPFYVGKFNHGSARGKDGDGAGIDQKPVSWFACAVSQAVAEVQGRPVDRECANLRPKNELIRGSGARNLLRLA